MHSAINLKDDKKFKIIKNVNKENEKITKKCKNSITKKRESIRKAHFPVDVED